MGSSTSPPRSDLPRPLDAREIGVKLDRLLADVAELAGVPRDGSPRALPAKALLACLACLTSRN
jgi:hypothetical protein